MLQLNGHPQCSVGATEIAGLDNDGPTKMQGWTLQDWTQTDGVARMDIAGLDIIGPIWRGGHCRTGQ